jgi:hypothetical protein
MADDTARPRRPRRPAQPAARLERRVRRLQAVTAQWLAELTGGQVIAPPNRTPSDATPPTPSPAPDHRSEPEPPSAA